MEPNREVLKDFRRRLARAEQDKNRISGRLNDIYRLVMPHRHIQGASSIQDSLDEIFDSTAIDALADFASDVLNAFTPPFTDEWVKLEPAGHLKLDPAQRRVLADGIAEYKATLWGAISESNLIKAARECYRDLATGTMAILIQDVHPSQPIECTTVPVSDLYIDRGPGGCIDSRFRKFKARAELVPVMWPGAKLPGTLQKSEAEIEVTEGMWRDWSDRGTEKWTLMVVAGSDVLLSDAYTGEGSCPMIVCPWDTDGSTAWGFGPLYNALPDIKTLNKATELVLRNADRAVDPPFFYDDDGVIDVSQGITAGTAIPRMPGSKFDVMETGANFDVGFIVQDKLEHRIKRALYQDKPEQLGRTPPTATQWVDMANETARRMGAPAGGLVIDWQFAIIKRFAYLLGKRGTLPEVKLGGKGPVALKPTSPLVRSQEQETAVRRRQLVSEVMQIAGPQQGALLVDMQKFGESQAKDYGLEGEGLIRSPEKIQEMVQGMAAMAQQTGMLPGQGGGQ